MNLIYHSTFYIFSRYILQQNKVKLLLVFKDTVNVILLKDDMENVLHKNHDVFLNISHYVLY